jgi:hypothetical protein
MAEINKITKELFIDTINAIQKQFDHDEKCHEAFEIILPNDFNTGYDNNIIVCQLIKLLGFMINDESSWIEYFIYDLEFGKKYRDGCVTDQDGTVNIDMSTPEKLFEYLMKE